MESKPRSRRFTALEGALLVVFLALIALLGARPIFAVDLFWHLKIGEVIAATGAIPDTDMFSAIHPESPWIQFQWLWEWIASEITSLGGLTALRASQAASLTLGFGALYAIVRRREGAAAAALIVALALLFLGDRFRIRPDGMNILGFIAALPILLGGWRREGRSTLVGAALLGAIWSNLHGGGSLLLVVMTGAIATGALAECVHQPSEGSRATRNRALWICLAATAGVLSNPILLEGLVHFTGIFSAATERIPNPEWNATWSFLAEGSHPHHFGVALLPTVIAIAWGVERARALRRGEWRAGDLGEAILAAGLLFIAHYWVRTAFLAIVPALFLIRRGRALGWFSPRALIALSLLITGLTLHYQIERGRGGIAHTIEMTAFDLEPTVFPEHAADVLVDAKIEGGIFNEGKWGGYLIWRTWPACRVFFDTRHNLTDPLWDLLVRSLHPSERPAALKTAFTEHELELAVFKGPVFPLLRPPPEWILLFKAGPEEVYQHRDGPHASTNLERAGRWLESQESAGDEKDASMASRIARIGGRQWLSAPWRAARMTETAKKMESPDRGEAAEALFLQARRLHRADHHVPAIGLLNRLLSENPRHVRARVHLALSHHALAESESTREALTHLAAQGPAGLRPFEAHQAEALLRHYGMMPQENQ
jgi:hypothetical protein